MTEKTKWKRMTICISEEEWRWLHKKSGEQCLSMSELFRSFLKQICKEEKTKAHDSHF